jgi:hypothetical protein
VSAHEETAARRSTGTAARRPRGDRLLPLIFFSVVIALYAAIGYGVYALVESLG